MRNLLYFTSIIFLLLVPTICSGPTTYAIEPGDTSNTYKIKLVDNAVFIGTIIRQDSGMIIMKTASLPKVEIPFKQIKSIERIDRKDVVAGTYWFPNPNATRYLFSTSAFSLKKGEGYYQNTYLFLNSFNVGVTDNISLGGGLEFISTFASLATGNFDPIFFITPKFGFEITEKVHAGGGLIYASIPGFDGDDRTGFGILYGIGTYGSIDHNITGGIGWGYTDSQLADQPFLTLSATTRIARKASLVTENWFIPNGHEYYNIYSYGVRFFGESISVDLAFLINQDIAEAISLGIPYVDFVIKF